MVQNRQRRDPSYCPRRDLEAVKKLYAAPIGSVPRTALRLTATHCRQRLSPVFGGRAVTLPFYFSQRWIFGFYTAKLKFVKIMTYKGGGDSFLPDACRSDFPLCANKKRAQYSARFFCFVLICTAFSLHLPVSGLYMSPLMLSV